MVAIGRSLAYREQSLPFPAPIGLIGIANQASKPTAVLSDN